MSHLALADARGAHTASPPHAGAKAILSTSTTQRQPHAEAGSRRAQVCVTITHLDGLVLMRSAFHCSMQHRSAVICGHSRSWKAPPRPPRSTPSSTSLPLAPHTRGPPRQRQGAAPLTLARTAPPLSLIPI
ncbi:pyridoxamine 5'-phosphate oxidase family protein [Ralstonia solanacearum]|uniref:pyridoxamine 5'-phosphate oxidase family protein n=1 Tax=Ralstonia solanacearum TaxID=305 RepID=UPI0013DE44C5